MSAKNNCIPSHCAVARRFAVRCKRARHDATAFRRYEYANTHAPTHARPRTVVKLKKKSRIHAVRRRRAPFRCGGRRVNEAVADVRRRGVLVAGEFPGAIKPLEKRLCPPAAAARRSKVPCVPFESSASGHGERS